MEYYLESMNKYDTAEILKSMTSIAAIPGGLEAIGAATVLALKSIDHGGVIRTKALDKMANMMALENQYEAKEMIQKLLNFGILKEYDAGYYLPEVIRNSKGPRKKESIARTYDRKIEMRNQRLIEFERQLKSSWEEILGSGVIDWKN